MNRHVDALQHHVRDTGEKRSPSAEEKSYARDSPESASGHEADSNSGSEFEHAGLLGCLTIGVPHVSLFFRDMGLARDLGDPAVIRATNRYVSCSVR